MTARARGAGPKALAASRSRRRALPATSAPTKEPWLRPGSAPIASDAYPRGAVFENAPARAIRPASPTRQTTRIAFGDPMVGRRFWGLVVVSYPKDADAAEVDRWIEQCVRARVPSNRDATIVVLETA